MKIETKYEIGTHIWVVYKNNEEVNVYDDYIINILINGDKELVYSTKETYEELSEDEIILFEDTKSLVSKIKKLMEEIRSSE